jgi:transcription initiation factor TFIID TATA-box-binding protein
MQTTHQANNPIAEFLSMMQAIQTHPVNAEQAKAFTARGSLSFPNAAQELSPPTSQMTEGSTSQAGSQQGAAAGPAVGPATPAATPGAVGNQGPSGITPTLQ